MGQPFFLVEFKNIFLFKTLKVFSLVNLKFYKK